MPTTRKFDPRIALWAHDKAAFDLPFLDIKELDFNKFVKPLTMRLDNIDGAVFPTKKQTQEEAFALAGDFPNNITEWLWSAPGTYDGFPWVLLCRLSTGAYAMFHFELRFQGLQVADSLAEIIDFSMGTYIYRLYRFKTTTDPSRVSELCDKQPHEPRLDLVY